MAPANPGMCMAGAGKPQEVGLVHIAVPLAELQPDLKEEDRAGLDHRSSFIGEW